MSRLGNWFRSKGEAIGRVIENVGNTFGSEKISKIGRNIQNACAEKVGNEKSYEKDKANIYTTDRLNEILVSFSAGYYEQATRIENSCISIVEHYYDALIKLLESAPAISCNKANLNSLKKGKSRIRQSISGGIKEPLAKKMSLDDSECLKILKMDQGDKKMKAMSSFSQKVINEALNNLSSKVKKSMNEQLEDIEDYLNNLTEEQEKEFANLKIQFDKMCLNDNLKAEEREYHCVEPLIIIDAVDTIKNILK